MELLLKYFPQLNPLQSGRLARLYDLYNEWNSQINVISRKDIEQLYLRHVLHSMFIAKIVDFREGTRILDAGTGGGFPGIPLAIMFPHTAFHLVDSIGKKVRVVNEIAAALELENVTGEKARVEDLDAEYDFVVSRAVKSMDIFFPWVKDKIRKEQLNDIPNGILYLKGGDLREELKALDCRHRVYKISDYFKEDYFNTKSLVHLFQ